MLRPSADLLGQLDDDPLGAADVAEPVAGPEALRPADDLRAMSAQAGDGGVDVLDDEGEMAEARCVGRRVAVSAPARRRVELDQLEPPVAVRGVQERELRPDAVEPDDAIHRAALDRPGALQLESQL